MTCTEEYKEHIEYTFHAFCKIVIRNASYTALRTWSRKHKREISLDCSGWVCYLCFNHLPKEIIFLSTTFQENLLILTKTSCFLMVSQSAILLITGLPMELLKELRYTLQTVILVLLQKEIEMEI